MTEPKPPLTTTAGSDASAASVLGTRVGAVVAVAAAVFAY
jgi:hypothetical protein